MKFMVRSDFTPLTLELDRDRFYAQSRQSDFVHLATRQDARAEVATFGLTDWIIETYNRFSLSLRQNIYDKHAQIRLRGSMRGFIRNMTEALSYVLVATKYSQDVTLASLSLLQSATRDILYNMESIYDSCTRLLEDLESMKNYFDFLDPKLNPSSTPRMEPFIDYHEPTGRGMKIVAKDLGFRYPSEAMVLKGLNFTIEPGEMIAIVGGNGSGKSTLVKLLARLYDTSSGSLEINGTDIRCYDKNELWSHMSILNQEFSNIPDNGTDHR